MTVGTAGRPAGPLGVTVSASARLIARGSSSAGFVDRQVTVPLAPAATRATSQTSICVSNLGRAQIAVLGERARPGEPSARVSDPRVPQTNAMRVQWFRSAATTRISRVGLVAHRYGLVKASFVGAWTFWVALTVLIAASAAAIGLAARESRSDADRA